MDPERAPLGEGAGVKGLGSPGAKERAPCSRSQRRPTCTRNVPGHPRGGRGDPERGAGRGPKWGAPHREDGPAWTPSAPRQPWGGPGSRGWDAGRSLGVGVQDGVPGDAGVECRRGGVQTGPQGDDRVDSKFSPQPWRVGCCRAGARDGSRRDAPVDRVGAGGPPGCSAGTPRGPAGGRRAPSPAGWAGAGARRGGVRGRVWAPAAVRRGRWGFRGPAPPPRGAAPAAPRPRVTRSGPPGRGKRGRGRFLRERGRGGNAGDPALRSLSPLPGQPRARGWRPRK